MSETVGLILVIIGLVASAAGMYLLSRTRRQGPGLAVMVVGLVVAGVGFLAVDESQVTERPPATVESGTPASPSPQG